MLTPHAIDCPYCGESIELLRLAPRCARDGLFWIGLPQAWSPRRG